MINRSARLPVRLTMVVVCLSTLVYATTAQTRDTDPAWLSMERGKIAYEAKDFGTALIEFDHAIAARRAAFGNAVSRLDSALLSQTLVDTGDSIRATLAAFAEDDFIRRDYNALVARYGANTRALFEAFRRERLSDSHRALIETLLLVLEYRTFESLDNSVARLRQEVVRLAEYPEAEYWKGRVFFIEGELGIAELQYRRAWNARASLEIPEERYTILYSMAQLHAARSDYVAWENVMKSILADGTEFSGGSDAPFDPFLRDAMLSTLSTDGFDRFMTLYRLEPDNTLNAHASLAGFYLERGRAAALFHAAVAVNMTLTRGVNLLLLKDRDYVWTSLDDFLKRAMARKDVEPWVRESSLSGILLTMADAMYVHGARRQAVPLWQAVVALGMEPDAWTARTRLDEPASAVRRAVP